MDIEGYKFQLCATNNKKTGGLMVLIRKDIRYKVRNAECVQNYVWLLSLEVVVTRSKYLFTVLYYPLQCENVKFIEYFFEYLWIG